MECDYCGDKTESLIEVENGNRVCTDCLDEFFVECDECGLWCIPNYWGDGCLCRSCMFAYSNDDDEYF